MKVISEQYNSLPLLSRLEAIQEDAVDHGRSNPRAARELTFLSGGLFSPATGQLRMNLSDVARSLSRIPRFNGHTTVPYSVAEHSLWVSRVVEAAIIEGAGMRFVSSAGMNSEVIKQLALAGLLHDAEESVTTDLPTPLKHLPRMHWFRQVADEAHAALMSQLGVAPAPVYTFFGHPLVKLVDEAALLVERRDLQGYKGPDLDLIRSFPTIVPVNDPAVVERQFIDAYVRLRGVQPVESSTGMYS